MRNDLRRARERAGLTQQELAKRCAVSRQTIIALEAGRYAPSTSLALQIARVLRARIEQLFWLDDEAGSIDALVATPPAAAPTTQPAVVASVGGRWVAHALPGESAATANALIDGGAAAGAERAAV